MLRFTAVKVWIDDTYVCKSIIEEKKKKIEKDFDVEQNVIKNNAIEDLKELLGRQENHGCSS